MQKYMPGRNIIKLDSNELAYHHVRSLKPLIDNTQNSFNFISSYPEKDCVALREGLSRLMGVNAGNILVTSGSSEAISLAIMGFTDFHSEIITSTRAFQLYRTCALQQNRHVITVDETPEWDQNLHEILSRITKKTRLIFITNPSNPLGTWINSAQFTFFLNALPNDITVVIDEAYFEFMENESGYTSAIRYIDKYSNLVITRTFSKLYGLAGLRIGYVIACSALIKRLRQNQLPFSVNCLAIRCAAQILSEINYYHECGIKIIKTRQHLYNQLSQLGFRPLANSANFLTFKTNRNSQVIIEKLVEKGIYVRDLVSYRLPDYIRVSIGTAEQIRIFYEIFCEIIET